METSEDILQENFLEYYTLACEASKSKKYNSATTLFFKAIVAGLDFYLLKKEGHSPSSHTTRFRMLQERHPQLYELADRVFPFYQDSYTMRMDKETADLLKNDAERIKKLLGI